MNDPANTTHTEQQRVLDELDGELQDPGAWDWDTPVELTAASYRTLTLMVRLGRDNARLLGHGAEAFEMKLSAYLVWAAKSVTHIQLHLDRRRRRLQNR